MTNSTEQRVLAANAAFYAAFRTGDMEAMEALWSDRDTICVLHPNARGIEGRADVMRSWEAILEEGGPPEIAAVDPLVIVTGNAAMVICEEKMGAARMIATNLFANESGVWRMVHHQATRLPVSGGNGSDTGASKGRRGRREKGR
jgi:ketosteroid isomerase-like protein